mgnify:CR=1 FL=1
MLPSGWHAEKFSWPFNFQALRILLLPVAKSEFFGRACFSASLPPNPFSPSAVALATNQKTWPKSKQGTKSNINLVDCPPKKQNENTSMFDNLLRMPKADLAHRSTVEEKPSFLFTASMPEHFTPIVDSAASDCDSFAGDGPPACDDLLEVDQDEIHVEFTFPSTIYMTPSSYDAVPRH